MSESNQSQTYLDKSSTLIQLIDAFSSDGENLALLAFTKKEELSWSYAALAHRIDHLAYGLKQIGVGPGELVAILAENCPESILACLAVIKIGAVIVPLNVRFSAHILEFTLRDSGVNFIFTTATCFKKLAQFELEQQIYPIFLDVEPGDPHSWQAISTKVVSEFPVLSPLAPAALFYTSGTTGMPKGVLLSHQNLVFQLNTLRAVGLVTDGERVLLPLPLYHVYSFVVGMLAPLALGLTIVLPWSLSSYQIIRALREGQITLIVGIPRFYKILYSGIEAKFCVQGVMIGRGFKVVARFLMWQQKYLRLSIGKWLLFPFRQQLAPKLQKIVSGGAALNSQFAWNFHGFGWQVVIGYGLTETSPILTLNLLGTKKLNSVGRPIPGIEIRIDPSTARGKENVRLGRNKVYSAGEVLVRGSGIFTGYHNTINEKSSKSIFVDGWFRTGDLGYCDEEGYLYILGRV
ncbi:AMP-dependent synthetase and ligase [Candidatus Nitrosoglobus terrae]|uniref:AMP-dependent synthetase and ligase n=1 Tax=Candidatus Nitrosoglobus terrae TaxID=1630141 RepID=A0A1Q2SMU1_9GAMM|nr:long-chain fatty acid--CoA ligase [Candidatus Nitrosoglobus terrae]BAW80433.1 AMP-dependent synthetase and ligase [Candidatus Nitrosoglobus terrae]